MPSSTTIPPLNRLQLNRATTELAARDPHLRGIVDRFGPPPLWARSAGFATLVRIILEQQVSLASAAAAYRRLSAVAGRVTPRRFLEMDDRTLRNAGFSRQKTRYCRALAQMIVEGTLDLRSLPGRDEDETRDHLQRVPGIGTWTSDIYLLMALRHPDIWPRGDLALVQSVRTVTGDAALDDAAIERRSESWRPWRSVAARLFWHDYLQRRR